MTERAPRDLTPADCLAKLSMPDIDTSGAAHNSDLFRVELRRAVLAIAELDHIRETAIVREVVTAVRGGAPEVEED
ncbi:hypothetical protein [Alloactinosynnema sp. L-07]|uniref:hypothetical protein n=1 Tax=Alloactinosynnema sp. L-07 TaxID=1653480 RepID=UPI00065F0587|nr:hypothetical protein [Alloactinosynnema sp. L-07]CRK59400.1 hypothetical protein [Alloactinosynnema sp. L-07]